jgi:hypothetical protein
VVEHSLSKRKVVGSSPACGYFLSLGQKSEQKGLKNNCVVGVAVFAAVVGRNFLLCQFFSARNANQPKRPETFFSCGHEIFSAQFEFWAESLWLLRSGVKKKANVMKKSLIKSGSRGPRFARPPRPSEKEISTRGIFFGGRG